MASVDLVRGLGPDLDELLATLVVGDQTALVLLSTLSAFCSYFSRISALLAAGRRRRTARP
jgi:hypothetical protein